MVCALAEVISSSSAAVRVTIGEGDPLTSAMCIVRSEIARPKMDEPDRFKLNSRLAKCPARLRCLVHYEATAIFRGPEANPDPSDPADK